jgi:hypothetical protein
MTKRKPTALQEARAQAEFWRKAHDRVSRQLELLLQLQARAAGPEAKPKAPRAPADVEAAAVERAQAAAIDRHKKNRASFVANASKQLQADGHDPVAAAKEAARLWDAATDFQSEG